MKPYIENLYSMIKQSENEFRLWNGDKDKLVLLQQAGEKLFCAVEAYITLKYNSPVKGFGMAVSMTSERSDEQLLYDARQLHRYFYNYTDEYPKYNRVVAIYTNVKKRLKDKIRLHLVKKYRILGDVV